MTPLLALITLWLSANFDLPANHDAPHVAFVSKAAIADFRYRALLGTQPPSADGKIGGREVVAVYDDATQTIYLPQGWSGQTPADISVLVHEMVHHLQNRLGRKFACPQEREQLAYAAQDRWLALFGRNLAQDFELDGFTLLATTQCLY